ncbi:hypothetical protein EFK50_14890 [Nocardioides marmoriginsengisoli]|uniref:Htaa domain-containing protein n=1 Tax=Nocardioides marmoriginsengisoli TaxID=661483 RepID=A0A3N0CI51_9ACTN|nr:hypothetical protein [Nocardioides marmoriginsengisoli]RNL62999.1 hypothetical protein EFK50_14890 [Nocardioides marmoriginsengisoli]
MRTRILITAGIVAAATLLIPGSAEAAARVTATNEFGTAQADPTYATTLTLRGKGFQSIKNGHGGVYVFFGTVKGTWRPSKGGQTGTDYLYVPDSEAKNNQGYQRFIAFPGSDTAASAQGILKADGSWSTTITVPGAKFNAVDRDGKAVAVDCLKVTCGIITIGAHGVKNARNESFSPVRFAKIYDRAPTTTAPTTTGPTTTAPTTGATTAAAPQAGVAPRSQSAAKPVAAVDQDTAVVGRVLSFTGTGFTPGEQVTASFDDGRAAVGPLAAGPSGEVAGVLQLPAEVRSGTHTLRLTGAASSTRADVNFPIRAAEPTAAADESDDSGLPAWAGWTFLGTAVLVLGAAVLFAVRRISGVRRRAEQGAAHAS